MLTRFNTFQRCSGVPPTILLSVFMHLQSLTHLRIRGAPSTSLPYLIAALPRLRSLDTDFTETGSARAYRVQLSMPAIEKLTLRAGSIDAGGPVGLWGCAQMLLSAKANSLKEFRLQAFATLGETSVPRPFILFMAQMHGDTLERFLVGTTLLTLEDVACICDKFPKLEELSCAIPNPDIVSNFCRVRYPQHTLGTQSFAERNQRCHHPCIQFACDKTQCANLSDIVLSDTLL